jgi:hypothetical protein
MAQQPGALSVRDWVLLACHRLAIAACRMLGREVIFQRGPGIPLGPMVGLAGGVVQPENYPAERRHILVPGCLQAIAQDVEPGNPGQGVAWLDCCAQPGVLVRRLLPGESFVVMNSAIRRQLNRPGGRFATCSVLPKSPKPAVAAEIRMAFLIELSHR